MIQMGVEERHTEADRRRLLRQVHGDHPGWLMWQSWVLLHRLGCMLIALGQRLQPSASAATGPYRWVRHPLYLSMILATIGLAAAFRRLWALVIILFVFMPAGLWRARLEEQALARRFGQEWEDYAAKTFFILPLVY